MLTVEQAHALRDQILAARLDEALPPSRRFGFTELQAELWVQSFALLAREIEAQRDALAPDVVEAYRDAARALRDKIEGVQQVGRRLVATTLRQVADDLDAALA
jgi:hypothetical protein